MSESASSAALTAAISTARDITVPSGHVRDVHPVARSEAPAVSSPVQDTHALSIPVSCLDDIVEARRSARRLAAQVGCSESRTALFLTAVSELARNIIMYAKAGEIILSPSNSGAKRALRVTARDNGPGIADIAQVFDRPLTGAGGHGLGLAGLRQVVDRFSIESRLGAGTHVICEVVSD